MASLLELTGYMQKQGDIGRERGQQSVLSQLASQSYGAPKEQRQSILSQMAGIDPAMAQTQAKQFQQGDSDAVTALADKTRYFVGQMKAGNKEVAASLYPQIAQEARAAGLGDVPLEWNDSFLAGMEQIAGYGQSPTEAEQFTLAPGSKRFDANGRVIAEVGPTPANAQYVDVPDGQGGSVKMLFDPRTGGFTQPSFGGGPAYGGPTESPIGAPDVQSMYAALGDQFGFQTTSTTRTPEQNTAANGVPNSQHLTGTARDFSIKGKTPEQVKAFMDNLRSQGFEAFQHDAGSGMHVHAELPPGARGAGGSQPGRLGYTPPKKADSGTIPAGYRQTAAGNLEFIPGGPADPSIKPTAAAKPMPQNIFKLREATIAEAETANGINTSLDKHLGRIQRGELEFGPVANRLAEGRNAAGLSSPQSRNFAEFRSDLEKLRNDSLRLNSGVQTDGDAQRAWNELFANINDTDYVKQRLSTIRQLNERAEMLKRASVDRMDQEYGGVGPGNQAPASGPQPGMIEAGYRFKGGDPADPNSWESI